MAAVAGCGGGDVIGWLASRYSAVVARLTRADHVSVIKSCPGPGDRSVAIVALLKRDNMVSRFAACDGAVVTARASPDHGRMIDSRHTPRNYRRVACIAFFSGANVTGGLSDSHRVVVTRVA